MIDDLDLDGMFSDEEERLTNAAEPIRDLDHIRALKTYSEKNHANWLCFSLAFRPTYAAVTSSKSP